MNDFNTLSHEHTTNVNHIFYYVLVWGNSMDKPTSLDYLKIWNRIRVLITDKVDLKKTGV